MNDQSAGRTTIAAFYSSSNGAGRSCMVANIALMLASQGRRVLAVDHDLASPSLHRYFSAFLPSRPGQSGPGTPVRLEADFGHPQGAVDFLGPEPGAAAPAAGCAVERPDLLSREYDVVLIDTPADTSTALIAGELADVVVLGSTPDPQYLTPALRMAEAIASGPRGDSIRILPVLMRVSQAPDQRTMSQRVRARLELASLLPGMSDDERQGYWADMEIPFEPEYAEEEGLPFLAPLSGSRERLAGAYLRIARKLLPGRPDIFLSDPPSSAQRLYREARREADERNRTVTVLHSAADRYWAEWITEALQALGLTAVRKRIDEEHDTLPDTGSTLIVVSEQLHGLERLLRQAAAGETGPGGQIPVAVTVDGKWPPGTSLPEPMRVSLANMDGNTAYRTLATYYRISDPDESLRPGRFPGTSEGETLNLPDPAHGVTGRDAVLDQIRDHFLEPEPRPLTITGPGGMSKTPIALEYARRFRACYDVIAFVQADSLEALRADLGAIAGKMLPHRPANDTRTAALADLQAANPRARWLLICGSADDPSILDRLIRGSVGGHVLIISGGAVREESDAISVPALAPADSEAMVMDLVPGISPGDAALVSTAMQGIPLALRLACARLQVIAGHLSERRDALPASNTTDAVAEFTSHFPADPGDIADPVEFVVNLHLTELAELTEHSLRDGAMLLLETCAFLGGSGLSWRLLRSPEMLEQLAEASPGLRDPVLLSVVFHEIASRGLLLFDESELVPGDYTRAPLRIHPRVLSIIRSRMSPRERELRSQKVSLALAALPAPGIAEDVIGNESVYAELLEHVRPSGAAGHLDPAIRTWLANQVRYLWQAGSKESLQTAVELGEKLSSYWLAELPEDDVKPADDPIRLRLRTHLANVYRQLGQLERAREIDQDTLARQRRVLGLRHPRTLMTARSYGADLRMTGDFEDALFEDYATWQAAIRALGRHHLITITASGNLALSELLAGDVEPALRRRLDQDLPWAERFDRNTPGETAWVLSHIGALQRELGEYKASRTYLRQARTEFRRTAPVGVPAPPSKASLRTEIGIAIATRWLDGPSPGTSRKILEDCQAAHGEDEPITWAARLSLAGDLAKVGDTAQAVRHARESLDRHRSFFGENHPFTQINRVNLSCYALADGQPGLAAELSDQALSSLESSLGPRHLWSVAATVARANVLAEDGHPGKAAPLEEEALSEYRRRLRPDHPFVQIVADNHDLTLALRDGSGPETGLAADGRKRRYVELHLPPY